MFEVLKNWLFDLMAWLGGTDHERVAHARERASRLLPYQQEGAQWLAKRRRALLSDSPGTGKTAQALSAVEPMDQVIVLCPAGVRCVWAAEAMRWRPDMQVIDGSPSPGGILILSQDHPRSIEAKGSVLIIDEVHRCNDPASRRTRKAFALARSASRVYGLSGTPMLNAPKELWCVLKVLGLAEKTFGSEAAFLALFEWRGGRAVSASPRLRRRLNSVMLRRTRKEVLPDLPGKVYRTVGVACPNELLPCLNRSWAFWPEDEKLALEEYSSVRSALADAKIPTLLKLVDDYESTRRPVVVFSAHLSPIKCLGSRPGWAEISGSSANTERLAAISAMQGGRLKGLALTIGAGSEGITLTQAADVVFVDLDWTPGRNEQAEDRLVRLGQRAKHVTVTRLVIDHPLEQHLFRVLDSKVGLIAASLEKIQ